MVNVPLLCTVRSGDIYEATLQILSWNPKSYLDRKTEATINRFFIKWRIWIPSSCGDNFTWKQWSRLAFILCIKGMGGVMLRCCEIWSSHGYVVLRLALQQQWRRREYPYRDKPPPFTMLIKWPPQGILSAKSVEYLAAVFDWSSQHIGPSELTSLLLVSILDNHAMSPSKILHREPNCHEIDIESDCRVICG